MQSKEDHSQALKGKAVIIVTSKFLPAPLLRLQEVLYRLLFVNQSVKTRKAKNCQGRYLAERGEMETESLCVGYARKDLLDQHKISQVIVGST